MITGMFVTLSFAQGVGGLRDASWELPKTQSDRLVLNAVLDTTKAVQTTCPQDLIASLAAENALAACAVPERDSYLGDHGRTMIGLAFTGKGRWVTPWQENASFGVVRVLTTRDWDAGGEVEYYIAVNSRSGLIYIVRFLSGSN